MDMRTTAAFVTGFIGILFLAGFVSAFRNRIYVGLLGLSFVTLAAQIMMPAESAHRWLRLGLLIVAGALFLGAVFAAVSETAARVRLLQEARRGREREMWEYLEQLRRRAAERQAQEETPRADACDESQTDSERKPDQEPPPAH